MNLKPAFFYFLYTLTAFFVIAWIVFPGQKAGTILTNKLNKLSDNVEVKMSKVKPGMLLICKIGHSEIIINNKVKLAFSTMKIKPSLFSLFSGEKKAKVNLSDIGVKIYDIPILKTMEMSELVFNNIDIEFKGNNKYLEITGFDAKGTQCNIKVKGNIDILNKSANSDKSMLDLQVNIIPNPPFSAKFEKISSISDLHDDTKEGIKLYISGTLKNPKIKL